MDSPNNPRKKKGISDLLDTVNGLLDLANRLQERGEEGISRTGEFNTDRGVTARYGIQIKTAGGNTVKDRVDAGEPIPPDRPEAMQEQAPVDVIPDGDEVTVIAEIPGVSEQSISTALQGQSLVLEAQKKASKWEQTVPLPFVVAPEPVSRSYNNGIFTVVLRRAS
jgi:HSP20 family molecular chaperone IbpA